MLKLKASGLLMRHAWLVSGALASVGCSQMNFTGGLVGGGVALEVVQNPPGAEPTPGPVSSATPAPVTPSAVSMLEAFSAPTAKAKADILFVVDTTPTMFVTITKIGNALGSVAALGGMDFQIGVLNATMNPYDGGLNLPLGQLTPMNTIPLDIPNSTLTILSPNLSDTFNNYIVADDWVLGQNMTFGGSTYPVGSFCQQQPYCAVGPAQPLKAIQAMIANKAMPRNAGFFRPGATLVPIIITASDEAAIGAGYTLPSALINAFNASLGSSMQGMKAMGVIVQPGDATCLKHFSDPTVGNFIFGGDQMYGSVISQFVAATGGSTMSICQNDFSSILASVPAAIAPAALTSVKLAHMPIAGSVKVSYAPSTSVPFTVSGQTVNFSGAVPPGTKVSVSYLIPGQ